MLFYAGISVDTWHVAKLTQEFPEGVFLALEKRVGTSAWMSELSSFCMAGPGAFLAGPLSEPCALLACTFAIK